MSRVASLAVLVVLAAVALIGCSLFQNRPPEASFVVNYDVDPEDSLVVELDASASSDPDGHAIIAYLWTFSEPGGEIITPEAYSAYAQTSVIVVRFVEENEYTVTLLVRDERGADSEPVPRTFPVPNPLVEPTE
jgi:hypothetical protein